MKTSFLFSVWVLFCTLSIHSQDHVNWVFQSGGRVYSSPLIVDEMIYFGSGDCHLFALNRLTGKQIWEFTTDGAVHSNPAVYENYILLTSADGYLYALEKNTGELVWKFKTEGEKMLDLWDYYISSPVVSENVVFFGSGDGHVYAINCTDGNLLWKYQTGDIVHADPLVVDGKVYIGNYGGQFFTMNAATGDVLWQFKTVGATYFPKGEVQKGAVYDEGVVYFGSRDYNVYAIDAHAGHGHWNRREEGSWVIATPLVYQGNIFFGTSDTHKFKCLNKKSGSVVWEISVPMRVYGSAVAYKGVIYFGCFDGIVRGADAQTGEIVWSFQTIDSKINYTTLYDKKGEFVEGFELYGQNYFKSERLIHTLGSVLSTPVIDNDIIYFGSSDGRLYSVNLSLK